MVPGVSIRAAQEGGTPGGSTVDPGPFCAHACICVHVYVYILANSPVGSL